jgi:hypothetical protein
MRANPREVHILQRCVERASLRPVIQATRIARKGTRKEKSREKCVVSNNGREQIERKNEE